MTANEMGIPVKRQPLATRRWVQTLDLRSKPDLISRYRELHSASGIWPEVLAGIRQVGILEMDIFLLGTRLVMIVEAPAEGWDWDIAMERLSKLPRQAEWEALTGQFQVVAEGLSSAGKWRMMERIFHLYSPAELGEDATDSQDR